MAKNEKTSKRIARTAAKLLRDRDTPADVKSVAASALTQAPDKGEGEGEDASQAEDEERDR